MRCCLTPSRGPLTRWPTSRNPTGTSCSNWEADATIPAEYVLLEHFLDRIDPALQARIGVYRAAIQGQHGGWPLFHDGTFNISATRQSLFRIEGDRRRPGRAAYAPRLGKPFWQREAQNGPTSSRVPNWLCSDRFRGVRCR